MSAAAAPCWCTSSFVPSLALCHAFVEKGLADRLQYAQVTTVKLLVDACHVLSIRARLLKVCKHASCVMKQGTTQLSPVG